MGNIGIAFIGIVDDGIIKGTYSCATGEVSSFHAQQVQTLRSDCMVWIDLAPDDLHRHHSLDAYFAAKYRLVRSQSFTAQITH
jgi:UDP-N-acetylmuramoylalanine--D-glutamate ligase